MRLILGALACWAGLHRWYFEHTRMGQRAVCLRCRATRWLRGLKR